MNVGKIVPPITERLGLKKNSQVRSLVIESLDQKKQVRLSEDTFRRYSKKEKDSPKNLFELLQRLLSPQKDDLTSISQRLSFSSPGYKVSAEVVSGKKQYDEVSASVTSHYGGFTTVGASNVSCVNEFFKQPKGIVADGYKNGFLVSSENHLPSGTIYYRDIIKNSDGSYQAGIVKDRAY